MGAEPWVSFRAVYSCGVRFWNSNGWWWDDDSNCLLFNIYSSSQYLFLRFVPIGAKSVLATFPPYLGCRDQGCADMLGKLHSLNCSLLWIAFCLTITCRYYCLSACNMLKEPRSDLKKDVSETICLRKVYHMSNTSYNSLNIYTRT